MMVKGWRVASVGVIDSTRRCKLSRRSGVAIISAGPRKRTTMESRLIDSELESRNSFSGSRERREKKQGDLVDI